MRTHSLRTTLTLALIGLGALAATAHAQETSPAAAGTPRAVIEETTHNAGEVPKGTIIEHDFIVRNDGDADLLVLDVKPACGCTTPGFDRVIAPGTTGKITLKVDTARFKGPISKSATVQTNDPQQPTLRLVVNATVQTFIDVLPRDVVNFRQYRGEESRQELTITSNEEGQFEIRDVQVTGESVRHELSRESDTQYKLQVWADAESAVGNLNGTLKLITNSQREPEVRITVRGTILGQISVNPSTLYFRVDNSAREVTAVSDNLNVRERGELGAPIVGQVSQGAPMRVLERASDWTRVRLSDGKEGWVYNNLIRPVEAEAARQTKVLNVTHRREASFSITGSQVQGQNLGPTSLGVTTETVREGQSYRVTVTYEGGLEAGNYTGELVLSTSDEQEPSITVPVYIVVT